MWWWTGAIPLAIACIGAAYAFLVFRGRRSHDNLAFGTLALVDASMTAWRGVTVLTGGSIVDRRVVVYCTVCTIALTLLTLEFLLGFPRRPAPSRKVRLALAAWGLWAVVLAVRQSGSRWGADPWMELLFFAPSTLIIFVAGGRALWCVARTPRSATTRAEQVVIAMLMFRWVFGFSTYFIGPMIGRFAEMVWAETTFASLVGFVVMGTSVLRTELFSLKQAASEVVALVTCSLLVVFGGGAAVAAALHWAPAGPLQSGALVVASFVPLALAAIAKQLYPRVLAPLDDRRRARFGVSDEPLPPAADAAIAEALRRVAQIAQAGAVVRWELASALPAGIAERLVAGALRRDTDAELFAALVAPALAADGAVIGAIVVDRGLVDRETLSLARDLAGRIGLVVERARALNDLEDARRLAALGQFAAAIAHDIRTPLTSISLNVQIIRRKLAMTPDDAEHLDIALEELARLDRSVAEILDFAKPVRLESEAIDVGELLEGAAKNLVPVLQERGVALTYEPMPAAGGAVMGDRQRLRQVVTNLVDNAANASAPGGEVTLRATRDAATNAVEISVIDRGRGIAAGDLARIFEPFFTTRPDGTGLGLAIVHKVIAAHGGRIDVASELAHGSTFTIHLPSAAIG